MVVGLGLGVGLATSMWQARLALAMYLAHLEKDKPAAPPQTDAALVKRLESMEAELARLKVERLTGRR